MAWKPVTPAACIWRTWTPIVARERACPRVRRLPWRTLPDAPLSLEDARREVAAGVLLMACRHYPGKVVAVVRPARYLLKPPQPDRRPPCPCCGGRIVVIEIFHRAARARAPPSSPPFTGAPVS
jgi:hypothetical protein